MDASPEKHEASVSLRIPSRLDFLYEEHRLFLKFLVAVYCRSFFNCSNRILPPPELQVQSGKRHVYLPVTRISRGTLLQKNPCLIELSCSTICLDETLVRRNIVAKKITEYLIRKLLLPCVNRAGRVEKCRGIILGSKLICLFQHHKGLLGLALIQ